jgi:hypothetical protein
LPELEFRWEELASGTRHVLAVVTLLLSSPPNSLILLEEPDAFLHGEVALELFQLCEKIGHEQAKQVIVTTHSPIIIEMTPADRLNVVVRDANGESQVVHSTDQIQRALDRHGVLRSFMLTPYRPGVIPAALLIVEGDDDEAVWTSLLSWEANPALRGVTILPAGGEENAKSITLYLRHLADSGVHSIPFLMVLDGNGHVEQKAAGLRAAGLREDNFVLLRRGELEDYLLDAQAIAGALNVTESQVTPHLARANGKNGLDRVVSAVTGRTGATDSATKGIIARHLKPTDELDDVLHFFREQPQQQQS